MFAKSKARSFKLALLASIAAAAAGAIAPTFAATATTTASASVVTPIAITSSGTLAFGKFLAGGTLGTVVIDTAGAVTKSGGVTLAGGTTGGASFTITGDKSAGYTIDTSATTSLTSAGNSMALALVTDFTGAGATSGAVTTGTIDATTGSQVLHVGGILSVAANQAAGIYSGTVSVAVDYQ